MKITIDSDYQIGEFAYVKTDPDQNQRVVIGINITPNDLLYDVSLCNAVSSHYGFELSTEKTIL